MPHLFVPGSLLLSLSCAPAALDSADSASPETASVPVGASPGWLEAVKARIAASARSIVPEGEGFTAALPAHSADARFTAMGLVLGGLDAAQPLHLRFSSWGFSGAEREVEPVEPALGDCVTGVLPEGDCARRLEYAHEGVTAWWVGLDGGLEFGWTVAAPPADGESALTFRTEVDGADWVAAAGDGAEMVDAAGVTWMVSGALAWGADGAPLRAWLDVEGDALVVRVDAEGAVYPVTVDPVLSTATTMLEGASAFDNMGHALSGAGDVNGDGYGDVIIAVSYYPQPYANVGRAWVYHGSSSGLSSTANRTLMGGAVGHYFGFSVSGAGDVNGDGYDDVIIGASGYDSGSLNAVGRVVIHHGSASGVSSSANLTLTGSAAVDRLGCSVSGAGDVNGDGYDDVIIGAYGHAIFIGRAYVHHGSASGLGIAPSLTLTGGTEATLGNSVSGAGDVNGDGYDDVIIGANGYAHLTNRFTGAVYIHHGSPTGVSSTSSSMLVGNDGGVFFGSSVSDAGDVNGDGYDDVIIGANGYDVGTAANAGAVFIHHGYADEDGDGVYLGGDSSTMQDCDDDDATVGTASIRYVDADGDGFGSTVTVTACAGAAGTAAAANDCDDARADVNPAAAEVCDAANADEDCDGLADDADPTVDALGFSTFYADADADGFGDASAVTSACDLPAGHVTDNTDCDDARADVYPFAPDPPNDGVDQNCDGRGAAGLAQARGKSGCVTAPVAPVTWLAALLALPAIVLRRRRA